MPDDARPDGAGQGAEVERVCHEEQLRVWANDLVSALGMGDFLREGLSYDEGLDLERMVMREIKCIVGSAFSHPERTQVASAKTASG